MNAEEKATPSEGAASELREKENLSSCLNRLRERPVPKQVDLPAHRAWTDEEIAIVSLLTSRADRLGVALRVVAPVEELCLQLDSERLHRRIEVVERDLPELAAPSPQDDVDAGGREEVLAFRDDPEHVVAFLEEEPIDQARDLLQWILHTEDSLYAQNLVRPYRDLIPAIVLGLSPAKLAQMLDGLGSGYAARVLCDDYTRVPPDRLGAIVTAMQRDSAAGVVRSMLAGADRPGRLAAVLRHTGDAPARVLLGRLEASSILRLVDAAETQRDAVWVLGALSSEALEQVLAESEATESPEVFHSRVLASRALDEPDAAVPDPRSPGWRPSRALQTFRPGRGKRLVESLSSGKWVHVDETLDGAHGPKRIAIDLLELDPSRFTLRCVSADRERRPTLSECAQRFPGTGEGPSEQAFRDAGLFRLKERATAEGAVAAINGNFYFDYGHYENAKILGFNCEAVPGLRFGDPIGWYVQDGESITPPVLNRCAFAITDNGPFIGRVKMTSLRAAGTDIRWEYENRRPVANQIGLYTPLFGERTPAADDRIDFCVVGHRVVAVQQGGDSVIPFTGFVLSLPTARAAERQALIAENELEVRHDLPAKLGGVRQAMACGPQLVRDGNVDIDFVSEEFGAKDSTVMSFFLPRLIDRYEAARSFLALTRAGKLVLGVVSGRAFGSGDGGQAAGMTFGELAQLAHDLGAHQAMGLDGGGSSSLVAERGGELRVLNVPTGGSDVAQGGERFIANGLFVEPIR